jgi:hypothetical protein
MKTRLYENCTPDEIYDNCTPDEIYDLVIENIYVQGETWYQYFIGIRHSSLFMNVNVDC